MEREIKEKAICLKSVNSGEADRILYLLSPDRGLFKCKIRGVKKPKAKLAFASFPFCFGEYLLVKTGSNYTVTNCNFIDNFSILSADINKYYAGAGILEIGLKITQENEDATQLFVSIIKNLSALAYSNVNIFLVLCKMLLDCLQFLGVGVTIEDALKTTDLVFDFETGRIGTTTTENSATLNYADYECIKTLLSSDIADVPITQKTSKNLLCMLVSYFEYKTDEKLSCLQVFCK